MIFQRRSQKSEHEFVKVGSRMWVQNFETPLGTFKIFDLFQEGWGTQIRENQVSFRLVSRRCKIPNPPSWNNFSSCFQNVFSDFPGVRRNIVQTQSPLHPLKIFDLFRRMESLGRISHMPPSVTAARWVPPPQGKAVVS